MQWNLHADLTHRESNQQVVLEWWRVPSSSSATTRGTKVPGISCQMGNNWGSHCYFSSFLLCSVSVGGDLHTLRQVRVTWLCSVYSLCTVPAHSPAPPGPCHLYGNEWTVCAASDCQPTQPNKAAHGLGEQAILWAEELQELLCIWWDPSAER